MRKAILLPAYVGIALLLACVVALLAALAVAPRASVAYHGDEAWFLVRCDFSHRSLDDPIVHPTPEHAHSHDFLGNTTTNADSTYDWMTTGINPDDQTAPPPDPLTTCTRPEDTAGYWFPTVSWNDEELTPNRVNFYYRAGGKNHTTVQSFPANLKVITDRATWYCGIDDTKEGTQDPPRNCKSGVLGLRIVFPDCLAEADPNDPNQVIDGGQVVDYKVIGDDEDPRNHRAHMARSVLQPDGTRKCPEATDPVPRLTANANFGDMPKTSGKVTLSSGAASTMHADFWNTWNQTELERLVVECINDVKASDPHPLQCRAPTGTA